MRPTAMRTVLRFAVLLTGVSATLRSECDSVTTTLTGGRHLRLGSYLADLLSPPRPSSQYKTTCDWAPPALEIWQHGAQPCEDGLLFVSPPEGAEASAAIFRTNGDLVWTQSGWGRTRDLRMQNVGDQSYITFWRYDDNSRHDAWRVERNERLTYMGVTVNKLDQSYEIVRELRPWGQFSSPPVELKLTEKGTAIMVMHNVTQAHKPFAGLQNGWINDAIVQEIDLMSNELVFEWRASHHFAVEMSQASIKDQGRTPGTAYHFFHATGLDIDHNGNYIIASRNMCNAAALRRSDGNVLWVLGGALNSFADGGTGQAVAIISSQGVRWHGDATLLLLDGGYVPEVEGQPGRRSNARIIHLDTSANTATLTKMYTTPAAASSRHAQGRLQRLRGGNVFVSWGDGSSPWAVAYTEYSPQGQMLCAARFREESKPSSFAISAKFSRKKGSWGRARGERRGEGGRVVSKHEWTGSPAARPVMVVHPQENALYVSWNGDTRTTAWLLRSNNTERRDGSLGVRQVVARTGFETRIPIPRDVGEVIEVMAVDGDGKTLVRLELIWSEGASGTWSTQRVLEEGKEEQMTTTDESVLSPLPWWQTSMSSSGHDELALSGLVFSVAVFVWRRWIRRRWGKRLEEGRLRDQRHVLVSKRGVTSLLV
ncbi:Arylsulfotransferase-like protein [Cordyceps javanica]|uniref:Arylsulfotransferase-like protein n=1 Tax=Cordyceps javanica TaxID=43265 RepID=A0A545V8D5_9HYPO|nr:Arylsulfotransferase-like protein [Cordyceps javanica]TQW08951.1 Arylsulfotransferase-like protein [Cordyceps javanica]